MDDYNLLRDQEQPLYNGEELSTYNLPAEVKLNFVLRYCYKIQKKLDLAEDELKWFYDAYNTFNKKEFREQELLKQNADLRRTIKEQHTQINELTLKLLSKRK